MTVKSKSWGGIRAGAGRKPGSGKFAEPTCCIRVPQSLSKTIKSYLRHPREIFKASLSKSQAYPYFLCKVAAGFPSPAEDYLGPSLDLNEHLVKNQSSTFFLTVEGDSMQGAGISDGDLLVVDRALPAVDGKIVIAAVNGDITVKRLRIKNKQAYLVPENPEYSAIKISADLDCKIWGVVTSVVHKF